MVALASTTGCGKKAVAIKVDGSSTVYPITEAAAEEFRASHPNVQVTVGISGTGGGFKKFCAGEFACAACANDRKRLATPVLGSTTKSGVLLGPLPTQITLPSARDGTGRRFTRRVGERAPLGAVILAPI